MSFGTFTWFSHSFHVISILVWKFWARDQGPGPKLQMIFIYLVALFWYDVHILRKPRFTVFPYGQSLLGSARSTAEILKLLKQHGVVRVDAAVATKALHRLAVLRASRPEFSAQWHRVFSDSVAELSPLQLDTVFSFFERWLQSQSFAAPFAPLVIMKNKYPRLEKKIAI